MTPTDILAIELDDNDANAKTIGDYLRRLLTAVWAEAEGFSGKRPFGNSGWEHDLYHPLVQAGLIYGDITIEEAGSEDEYVEIENIDYKAGDKLIFECIDYLFSEYVPKACPNCGCGCGKL